jgi:hypothetical protein
MHNVNTIKYTIMKKFAGICGLFLLFLISCGPTADKTLLHGQWKGAEWIVVNQPGTIDASLVSFSFGADGRYTYTYNEAMEQGDYFVSNNELYTTPDGGTKMMVKIEKLTTDSLVFRMNRGGTSEVLTLVKQ